MQKDPFCRTPVWSKRETFLFNFCSSVREIWATGTQNTNPYLLFSSKMKYIFVNFTLLSPRSIGGTKKKKSWVSNALNPTYRWALVTPWSLAQELFYHLHLFGLCWKYSYLVNQISLWWPPSKLPWSATQRNLDRRLFLCSSKRHIGMSREDS